VEIDSSGESVRLEYALFERHGLIVPEVASSLLKSFHIFFLTTLLPNRYNVNPQEKLWEVSIEL